METSSGVSILTARLSGIERARLLATTWVLLMVHARDLPSELSILTEQLSAIERAV